MSPALFHSKAGGFVPHTLYFNFKQSADLSDAGVGKRAKHQIAVAPTKISELMAWCARDLSRSTIQRAQTPRVLDTVAALYMLLRRSPWFSIEIKGIFPSDPESSVAHGEAHLPLSAQIFAQRCKSCDPTTRGEELVLIRQRVIPS